MRKCTLLLIVLLVVLETNAKEDPRYPVSEIPEDMKTGMYAVIREQESIFSIQNRNSSTQKVRLVITILNSNANRYASLTLGYDKFSKIESLKANVYDAGGRLIKKLKPNEIIDQSSISDFSLFEDSRLKHIDLTQNNYPYTVEFEYVNSMKFLYFIPQFELYSDDEISIQKSTYSIIYPRELKPRYKLNKTNEPKVVSESDKREKMYWNFENIKPFKFETLSPYFSVVPSIIVAPNDFEYGGYSGKMDTWENLGRWQIQLNEGRDQLSDQTKQKIKQLVIGMKSDEEKIKVLYEFMQNKTRYVSIQRGIGGMQPLEAKSVDQLGYGDCKALSNYMVALLKEVGIKGYYTQVYGSENNDRPVPVDFPIDYFNHIIVAVPQNKDTVWLECTNQTKPFNYLGLFTCDRYALMITEEGGKLVKTPDYSAQQNIQARTADVFLDLTGNAKAKVKTSYSGLQYENNGLDFYISASTDDQKKWIQKFTGIPSFEVSSFKMINNKGKIPTAILNADLSLQRWATVSGKRIFLTPNLMNRSTFIPEKVESRKTNFVQTISFTHLDTIRYHLPEGIYPEFLPEPTTVKSPFGEYETTYQLDQGSLLYIRKLKINKGEYPADAYKDFSEFFKNINRADNTKIVFLSKT